MTTSTEFIEREIEPTLIDYVDDYDMEAIFNEVAEFDEREGFVWKPEYEDDSKYWAFIEKCAIN
jgi:hypothetical protein